MKQDKFMEEVKEIIKADILKKGFAASDPGTGYQAGQVDLGAPFP